MIIAEGSDYKKKLYNIADALLPIRLWNRF